MDVSADSGIEVSGGGTYGIGKTVTITAAPSGEAEITRVQVTRTDAGQANTADLADGAVQIGDKTYPFSVYVAEPPSFTPVREADTVQSCVLPIVIE